MLKTIEYLNRRFACKIYQSRMIEKDKLDAILEAGRLSPSSFGLEPWTFHIAKSEMLLDACFYQESMKTAPITVVITAKRGKFYAPDSEFLVERASRFPGALNDFIEDFRGYYEFLRNADRLDVWSKSQCYIAAMSMMIAATEEGIASCAIEGYDNDRLLDALGVSKEDEVAGIAIAFGYSAEPEREKIRESLDAITIYHF